MVTPLRICLIMKGDRGWIGGTEYIKNIIFALAHLPAEARSTFELCLICNRSCGSDLYDQISPYLSSIYYQEDVLDAVTLQNRIWWMGRRRLLGQYDPRFEDFIRKAKFDFVYPYFVPGKASTGYRSAAWISDFQHKSLPQFFSREEVEARDRDFAQIARYASTVVLSSRTSEAEFQRFFPEAAHKSKVLSFSIYPSSIWYELDPRQAQHKYSLPERFFLVSNQFWQHKNHMVIFEALKLLQRRSIYPIIVCTGHIYDYRKPDYSDTILQTIHKLGIAGFGSCKQRYVDRLDRGAFSGGELSTPTTDHPCSEK